MIVTHQAGTLRLRFRYNPDTVAMVKCAPDGRRYDPKTKEWVLPASIDNVRFCIDALGADCPELRAMLADAERPLVSGNGYMVEWRTTPFRHQVEGLDLLLNNDNLALFWEMGTGKTLVTIKAIEHRMAAGLVRRALVICPKTVISSWLSEFGKFSALKPAVVGGRDRDGIAARAKLAIVNWDLLRLMKLGQWDMVVFDESQYAKGHTSQRSKAAYALAKTAKYRVLLTGTPVAKDAGDLFGQFKILDESIFGPLFYAFRNKYYVNVGRNLPDWQILPEANEAIKAKVALRAQRIRKADVLDLPEKLYQVRTIEMAPAQAKAYRGIEKDLLAEIETADAERVTIAVPYLISRMMVLNEICSGFIHRDRRTFEMENPKLAELKQIIDDYDGKVVVWCVFLHDIAEIVKLYPNALVIDGSKSVEARARAIDDFQNGTSKIIILQQQAGAVGITLTAAHLSIFYSRNYSLLDRVQAEDRLHRIGQRNAVTYIDLVMENSIEQDIIVSLAEKRMVAGYLQGDIEDVVLERFKKRGTVTSKASTGAKSAER